MNNVLVVEYDPFSMESRVSIIRGDNTTYAKVYSNIDELTENLIVLAYESDVYNIKVHGPFEIAEQLGKKINEYELNQYSQNKITVEDF